MNIVNNTLLSISSDDIVDGTLVIPNNVTNIDSYLFDNSKSDLKESITNLIISDNVSVIPEKTFKECRNLKSIKFSKNLKTIGDSAFSYCVSLKNLDLPKNLEEIGHNAFDECTDLEKVSINSNLKTIKSCAFADCINLKEINLPDSITTMNDEIFLNCKKLESISLPKNLDTIKQNMFLGCDNLKSIELKEGLKVIEPYAFDECENLKSINLPSTVEQIGQSVFCNCKNLENVKLSKNLKSIGPFAFFNCHHLKEINLPESLISIDKSAFSNCYDLENVTLPKSLKELKYGAFSECTNLKSINIPENISTLSPYLFFKCENLEKITLPKKLKSIEECSFSKCHNLKTIEIPENVEELKEKAFFECLDLSEIKLSNSLKSIGTSCFANCVNLTELHLPENLQTIEQYAFSYSGLKNIEIPDSVKTLDFFAFFSSINLKKCKLPKNINIIESGLFRNCSNLEDIEIPNGVEKISAHAFSGTDLKNIKIPESVKIIDEGAFSHCQSLENIEFSEGLKKINGLVFLGCDKLEKIHFPNSLTNLNTNRMFYSFFEKEENGFTLSNTQTQTSLPLSSLNISLPLLSRYWDKKNMLLKEQKDMSIVNFYNDYLLKKSEDEVDNFINNHNFTFFKQLQISNFSDDIDNVYKFLYNIGVFSTPIQVGEKKIDYAQKMTNFLKQLEEKGEGDINYFSHLFRSMGEQGIKPEFNEFFIKDYDKLKFYSTYSKDFFGKCYNDFEKVQKTNTNNHGSQRQLKPTAEKFFNYFNEHKFSGITPETKDIATTIAPYFDKQELFDDAVNIIHEKQENNVPDNILGFHLKENSQFKSIVKIGDKIKDLQSNIAKNLVATTNYEFTYDWIEKNDPQNFILGKLCSCCSHLEGVGYGIMRASIVHPFIQNLVIRDKNNNIVAKSTLYVNPVEGYGVFNNVEATENVGEREKLYNAYIRGVKDFANEYNKQNPKNPLKKINVGMNLNDLGYQISTKNHESEILKPIDYAKFGNPEKYYSGDSFLEQYTVWENPKFKHKKEQEKEQ